MNDSTNLATPVEGDERHEILPLYPYTAWFRVVAKNSSSIEVTDAEYESELEKKVAAWYEQFSFAAVTLGGVVDSLKTSIDYNGLYNSFLLGQISENEFEKEASAFTIDPLEMETHQLYKKVDVLLKYTESEFTSSEIAEIFQVTDKSIGDVVEQLKLKFDDIEQVALPFIDERDL